MLPRPSVPRAGLDAEIVTKAAAAIVDADGLPALTLARLAAVLGVAPPSLYKHVGGLEDLTIRLTTLAIRGLADELTAAAIGRARGEALRAITQAYRRFAVEHAGLYSLTQAAPAPTSDEQQAEVTRALRIFQAVISSFGVPEEALIHAIRLVRAGLHGFADIEVRGGFQMSQSVDQSFDLLIKALETSLQSLTRPTREFSDAGRSHMRRTTYETCAREAGLARRDLIR